VNAHQRAAVDKILAGQGTVIIEDLEEFRACLTDMANELDIADTALADARTVLDDLVKLVPPPA
jgi:hypothetical protein